MALFEFINDLPAIVGAPPLNDQFLDEHLFTLFVKGLWYDEVHTYLYTHKFGSHLSHDIIVAFSIILLIISVMDTFYTDRELTPFCNGSYLMTWLNKSSTNAMVALVVAFI